MSDSALCKICGSSTEPAGSKQGKFIKREFLLRRCPECHFSFVDQPCLDYDLIYSDAYYAGVGADPLVDYLFELEHPRQTIRLYEWRGILAAVSSLLSVEKATEWLDFGCGNGGLVRYCREKAGCHIVGFEQGAITKAAREHGIPLLPEDQLDSFRGAFDVVTAIEVLEHVPDPLLTLRQIRGLLKPGGLFFYTTGNAKPYRGRLAEWRYVTPEIHISFFEPATLRLALTEAGFDPANSGYLPGYTDIVRFKILKNLDFRRRSALERIAPWPILSRAAARKLQLFAHPIGWARP